MDPSLNVVALLLQHLGGGLVDNLYLPEVFQEVSIEVHVEFSVVIKGQSELVLLILADLPPLGVSVIQDKVTLCVSVSLSDSLI